MTISRQTIWIARHGNRLDFVHPEWFNTAARRYDPPLSDDGAIQAQQLADRLRTEPIGQIFASPFRRCVQTAHAVAEALELPLQLEWGLGEWLNADWMTAMPETAPIAELQAEFPRVDPASGSITKPQYPETEPECLARSGYTARAIADRHLLDQATREEAQTQTGQEPQNRQDILFVGHGATVHGMIWGFLEDRPIVKAPLCCLTRIDRELDHASLPVNGETIATSTRLILNCDTSHLSQPTETLRFN